MFLLRASDNVYASDYVYVFELILLLN